MGNAVKRVDVCAQMMLEVINDAFQELLVEGLSWHALNAQDVQNDVASAQALAQKLWQLLHASMPNFSNKEF